MRIYDGNIMLIHSKNFTARLIHFGMNVKRWLTPSVVFNILRMRQPIWKKIDNHSGIGKKNNQVQEAIHDGIVTHDINVAFKDKKNNIIKIYLYNWTEEQLEVMRKIGENFEGKKYQFSNFLMWAVNILTFGVVWIGKKSNEADNKGYCTEIVGTQLYYATSPQYSKNEIEDDIHYLLTKYWKTSPSLLQNICEKYFTLHAIYEV